jgi:prepilin-type processing-associated H-X9-DG protein
VVVTANGAAGATITAYFFGDNPPYNFGVTNYLGCIGTGKPGNTLDRYAGIFLTQSQLSMAQLTGADGAANTLMFGEHSTTECTLTTQDNPPRAYAWIGTQGMWTRTLQPTTACWASFSSSHTGVLNFAFGDGSVRAVNKSAAQAPFQSAGGFGDGDVYDPSALGS